MAIEELTIENDFMVKLVKEYQETASQESFYQIYRRASKLMSGMVIHAKLRYKRLNSDDIQELVDESLMDAVARYEPKYGVPFKAWLHFLGSRRIREAARATYYTGQHRDTERPQNTSIESVIHSMVAPQETSIEPELSYLKSINPLYYNVAKMLVDGYDYKYIGQMIGGKKSVDAAKSWVKRIVAQISRYLAEFRLLANS